MKYSDQILPVLFLCRSFKIDALSEVLINYIPSSSIEMDMLIQIVPELEANDILITYRAEFLHYDLKYGKFKPYAFFDALKIKELHKVWAEAYEKILYSEEYKKGTGTDHAENIANLLSLVHHRVCELENDEHSDFFDLLKDRFAEFGAKSHNSINREQAASLLIKRVKQLDLFKDKIKDVKQIEELFKSMLK